MTASTISTHVGEQSWVVLDSLSDPAGYAEIIWDGEDVLLDAPEAFAYDLYYWAEQVAACWAIALGCIVFHGGWAVTDPGRAVYIFHFGQLLR